MKDFRFWFTVAVVGLLVVFTLQNVVDVRVTFLFWTIELPQAILLFAVFIVGMLTGWILKSVRHPRQPQP